MANNKSTNFDVLIKHVFIQFVTILLCSISIGFAKGFPLALLNCFFHGIIDWHIWKLYKFSVVKRDPTATKETWKYYQDHWFYATIGLDQLLHVSTLIVCYYYSINNY